MWLSYWIKFLSLDNCVRLRFVYNVLPYVRLKQCCKIQEFLLKGNALSWTNYKNNLVFVSQKLLYSIASKTSI